MSLKFYKPTTSSQRGLVLVDKSDLWKGKPFKKLVKGLTSSGGRNNYGNITVRHRGGGHKRKYRIVDFVRNRHDIEASVERVEYDCNRGAFIALIKYTDGVFSYIIAPHKIKIGEMVLSSSKRVDIKTGNCMPLSVIPIGTLVHNVELYPGAGGQIARGAGCYVQLMAINDDYAQLKLRSGEIRLVRMSCKATIGVVSNVDLKNESHAKAGRNRWKGIRPTVRGVAMNPVDHPHGGGEGKTSGGRHPVSRWGKSAKGKRTRKSKKLSSKYIVRPRYM